MVINFDAVETWQLILLALFGAVDEPLASCVVVLFLGLHFQTIVGV